VLLVAMRVLQGLALGGEYGGAATYIAEHAPDEKRGFYTSWIQTTATLGIVLALLVILVCRLGFGEQAFGDWAWRVPFLISAVLVGLSIYIRLKLEESPGQGVAKPGVRKLQQRQELGADPVRAVRRHRS
jgi:MFS family permease